VEEVQMHYEERFTDEQLSSIVEQGMVYMCACPAQVAEAVRKLRELRRYQMRCISNSSNDSTVHQTIADNCRQLQTIADKVSLAHGTMQDCLEDIIQLEGWDRTTLEMPAHLRKRLMQEMLSED
jgi:hypothetical protein